jgi:hypothetical protein
MILWAIDGSSIPLPETGDLWNIFGGASNQTGEKVSTTARICCVYDVLNEIIIKSNCNRQSSTLTKTYLLRKGRKNTWNMKKNSNFAVVNFYKKWVV